MVKKSEDYNGYMRVYMLERYRRRREEILERLGGACTKCGSEEELEIDHKDRKSKEINLGRRLSGLSQTKLEKELKKCQLLCRPCHEKKSLKERGQRSAKGAHGTLSSYRWCGPPKCSKCKKAKNEYAKQRRRRMKMGL